MYNEGVEKATKDESLPVQQCCSLYILLFLVNFLFLDTATAVLGLGYQRHFFVFFFCSE